ncbi:hypothetical protein BDV96DRAFT_692942 [Lophiotrema nucula]|uniref:Uncharacterized protein n=1 Tax=Lophiotrema nucula TaxID=690887 RepID=A0A6A5YNL9_9PLEO|nr:hypothetical protein BDV96DRAFT_692942 [Lophiotrema nucula]
MSVKKPSSTPDLSLSIQLINSLNDKLPRELRDEIYAYMFEDSIFSFVHYHDHSHDGSGNWKSRAAFTLPTLSPYFLNPELVDGKFVYEAAEWLCGNCLHLTVEPSETMTSFLTGKLFGLKDSPPFAKLQNVQVNIRLPNEGCIEESLRNFSQHLAATLLPNKPYPAFKLDIDILLHKGSCSLLQSTVSKYLAPILAEIRRRGGNVRLSAGTCSPMMWERDGTMVY